MSGILAMLVYIGCYTDAKNSDGIVAVDILPSGEMRVVEKYKIDNAIYLTRSPDGMRVYSSDANGIVAFLDENGSLKETDRLNLNMRCICHLSVSADGKKVFFAEYIEGKAGSVEVDGGVFGKCVVHSHSGSGPNKPRQNSAHCHQAVPSPDGGGYIVVDLGIDSLVEYRFDAEGKDSESSSGRVFKSTLPGAGPRHLVFHDNGKMAFVVSELYNKLESVQWDCAQGFTKTFCRVNTLASDDNGRSEGRDLAAAVRMAPCGKRVVMSNRGENSLVVFDCDEKSGNLQFKSRTLLPGSWPRDFVFLSPTLAMVTMERSGEVHTLRYDPETSEFKVLSTLGGLYRPVVALP